MNTSMDKTKPPTISDMRVSVHHLSIDTLQTLDVTQIEEIVHTCCLLLINDKIESCEGYKNILVNVINSVQIDTGYHLIAKLISQLLHTIKQQYDELEKTQCFQRLYYYLDILQQLIVQFGLHISESHLDILQTMKYIFNPSNTNKIIKQYTKTIQTLANVINDYQFHTLFTEFVIDSKDDAKLLISMQILNVISIDRITDHRYMKQIVPLLSSKIVAVYEDIYYDIKLKILCLDTLNNFMKQTPKQMRSYNDDLMKNVICLMSYNEQADSYKVRKSAVQVLQSFIKCNTATHTMSIYQHKILESLLRRFKEPNLRVRLDIFKTFRQFLMLTVGSENGYDIYQSLKHKLSDVFNTISNEIQSPSPICSDGTLLLVCCYVHQLEKHIHYTIPKCVIELIVKYTSTVIAQIKYELFQIVSDLRLICNFKTETNYHRHNDLTAYYFQQWFVKHVQSQIFQSIVQNVDVELTYKALQILYLILKTFPHNRCLNSIQLFTKSMLLSIVQSMNIWYHSDIKVIGMLIMERVMEIIRPEYKEYDHCVFDGFIRKLFDSAVKQILLLKNQTGNKLVKVKQVKIATLKALSSCLSHYGDVLLSDEIDNILTILYETSLHEETVEIAFKCFERIISSQLNLSIASIHMNKMYQRSCVILEDHKLPNDIHKQVVITLKHIIQTQIIDGNKLLHLLKTSVSYINSKNFDLCAVVLQLNTEIIQQYWCDDNVLNSVLSLILPYCYKLIQSPTLQDHNCFIQLKHWFKIFYGKISDELSFEQLKTGFINHLVDNWSYFCTSECLSELIDSVDSNEYKSDFIINNLLQEMNSTNTDVLNISLLTIGEISKSHNNLLDLSNLQDKIYEILLESTHKKTQLFAAISLKNVIIANLPKHIPYLLEMISKCSKNAHKQYLLLITLKHIIDDVVSSKLSKASLQSYLPKIASLLQCNAVSSNIEIRTIIAEILGKSSMIGWKEKEIIFERIKQLISNSNVHSMVTGIIATRHAACYDNSHSIEQNIISILISTLNNTNAVVKIETLLTINTILEERYQSIVKQLDIILPIIGNMTIDNELEVRKAAFKSLECVTITVPVHILDIWEIVKYLKNGFVDDSNEIQELTYNILYEITLTCKEMLLGVLDTLPPYLMKGMKRQLKKAKEDHSNSECEKAKYILKIACKAIFTLMKLKNVVKCRKFCSFYARVQKTKMLIPFLSA
eukprot:526671_1